MKKNTFLILIITALSCFNLKAQVQLYGVAQNGGANYSGTLFKYDVTNNSIVVKHHFIDSTGSYPSGKLILASNGKLYGATRSGAAFGSGSIFEYDPVTEITSPKASFDGAYTGGVVSPNIIQLNSREIAGVCGTGGTSSYGTLWIYNILTDTIITLYNFDYMSGSPFLEIFQASNGKLYGATGNGRDNGYGMFFEFDLNTNTINVIKEFDNYNSSLGCNLAEVNGKLFGTFWWGGAPGAGSIFEYDLATQTYTNRNSFFQGPDLDYPNGATPATGLKLATDGLLYGTASNGGAGMGLMGPKNGGTLYSFDPNSGDIVKHHDFSYETDGDASNPVMQASDGNIYGMTYIGNGSLSSGSIYRYNITTGMYDTLKSFDPFSTGSNPQWTELTEIVPSNPLCNSLTIQKIITHVTCYGSSDGAIDISVSGATSANYSFLWSNGAITEDITDLPAGNYSVKVVVNDLNACEKTEYIRVFQPTINTKNCTKDLVNGTVSITAAEVFDERFGTCGIASMTVSPSEFTCANIGPNIVTLTVTDSQGNIQTKPAAVIINGTSKDNAYISFYDSEFCPGKGTTLTADVYSTLGDQGAISYLWSTSATTQAIDVTTAADYSVTFTFANGCDLSTNYTYNPADFTPSYTIIGMEEVAITKKSTVNTGGVGAIGYEGTIKVETQSLIKAPGTFAKAFSVNVKSASVVTQKYEGIPAYSYPGTSFDYSPACYDGQLHQNVRVRKNTQVTLADEVYGTIVIENGATVTFANSTVYADKIETGARVKINFMTCAQVALCGDMIIGENNEFNADNKSVKVSAYGNVSIASGTTLHGTVNSLATFTTIGKPMDKNNLTGLFLGNKVYSEYTNFNLNTVCGNCGLDKSGIDNIEITDEAILGNNSINIYPNPSDGNLNLTVNSDQSGQITVSVVTLTGQVLMQMSKQNLTGFVQMPIDLTAFSNGIYFIRIQVGEALTIKKVIVNR